MSPELIKITKKVDSFRNVLKENGFENLECFWYSDGYYSSNWNNMSVANEKPDREESMTFWQFGFKCQNEKIKRMHLEALMPVFEDYFTFDLRYYPGGLKFGLILRGNSSGHVNIYVQLCNTTRRLRGHVLFNVNLHAFQIHRQRLCGNAHDGGDARG